MARRKKAGNSLFKDFLKVPLLKRDSISRVADSEQAGVWSAGILLASIIMRAASKGTRYPELGFILTLVIQLVGLVVSIAIIHTVVTRLFKGKSHYVRFFRTLGAQSLIMVIGLPIIMVLGILAMTMGGFAGTALLMALGLALVVWFIVISVVVLSEVYRISIGKAIAASLVAGVIMGILALIVGAITASAMLV